jgi:hypothetical protein
VIQLVVLILYIVGFVLLYCYIYSLMFPITMPTNIILDYLSGLSKLALDKYLEYRW